MSTHPYERFPRPSRVRRRDRHGRGLRGPIMPPTTPAWRTRAERFDDIVSMEVSMYRRHLGPEVDRLDYGVLDVPESDPTPWEDGVPQARFFPMDKATGVEGRIVFYRRPMEHLAPTKGALSLLVHAVVTQQLANFLGRMPEDIDYHNH
ncbi:MAG: metallopeptidase family protein [Flaviflexus sp.]|uniref:metallopeptidase family protein n=1 Tax=Flaviflexus sp. TaxID=1969482 RepID=UPI00352E5E70